MLRFLLLQITLAGILFSARADWPEFRGPFGDGHVSAPGSRAPALPLTWSETNHVKWKTPIPHKGWSTPAILDNQVWLTTASVGGNDFFVLCVDATSGEIRLNQKLFHSDSPEPLGNNVNAYATPSPTIEKGRVYIHFGSYGTACLDTSTFKTIWERSDLRCRHYRGPASSPIIFEDLLILTMDGVDLQYVVALNKKTGETVWKTDRSVPWNDENVPGQMARDGDLRKAHSTPLIVTVDGKPLMLSGGAKAAYGYDPRTGKELWRVQCPAAWSVAPRPLYQEGLALFVSGLGKTELLAIRVGGTGDVTDSAIVWRTETAVSKTASPILVDGRFYMVSDDGMVTCLEPATGKEFWHSRIPGSYAASPIYNEGRIYFFNQQGKGTVVKPGDALEVLASNSLADGMLASPAVAGNALFLRTKTHLYRLEE